MDGIKSRKELISEISNALQMHFDEGCFYLSLTEQEVGLNAPAAVVGEDCVWPHVGDEVIRIDPLESRESFKSMVDFARSQGFEMALDNNRRHHEIYLSDPRKTAAEKLRTVIRHPVKKIMS